MPISVTSVPLILAHKFYHKLKHLTTAGKNLEEGKLLPRKFCNFEGNFVILRGKKKEIHKGKSAMLEGNFAQLAGKQIFSPGPAPHTLNPDKYKIRSCVTSILHVR